jgi:hypothetical protein
MSNFDTSDASVLFPSQTIAESKKTDSWHEKCCKAAIALCSLETNVGIRLSKEEMRINRELVRGEQDPRDVSKVFNPLGDTDIIDAYANIENYHIEAEYFSILIGESSERAFNKIIVIENPDIRNKRMQEAGQKITDFVLQKIQDPNFDPKQAKEELKNLSLNRRELEEIRASQLLNYVERFNNLEDTFLATHYDQLEVAEEIVSFDNRSGQLYIDKVYPEDLYNIRSGNSSNHEDSDIIVHVSYLSPFTILDRYKDKLKSSDKKKLDGSYSTKNNDIDSSFTMAGYTPMDDNDITMPGYVNLDDGAFSIGSTQRDGDLRVVRVCWKSSREFAILRTEDDAGNVFEELVDAEYTPIAENGETVSYIDLPEWRECTMIGKDIFINHGVFFGNVYSGEDFRLVTAPYIGYIFSISGTKATCPVSQIKSLKYLYNIVREDMKKSIGRNMGNVLEMDFASIPEGWGLDKILYYMKNANIKVVDSFATDPEDPTNKTKAGTFNTTGRVVDMGQTNHIAMYNDILRQIKQEVGELLGITPQRLGAVSNRETKGGIERSVVQSSNTTEPLFKAHERFKLKVLNNALNLAKTVYKGRSLVVQNNLDDISQGVIELDVDSLANSDLGIFVSNSKKDTALREDIRNIAPIMFQNDRLSADGYIKLKRTDDPVIMQQVLKEVEDERKRQAEQAQQAQAKQQEQMLAAQAQKDKEARDFETFKIQQETQKEILLKEIDIEGKLELEALKQSNTEVKDTSTEDAKLNIAERKLALEETMATWQKHTDTEDLKLEKQKLTINRNKKTN